ncbi:MurR/RpiR family transcriptional regulator [Streptococcus pseudoporcinus]|uniref:SIS domain protein n=1 Tax=Streptococcus pseudoporcinus LQ 940-04 TaxID=875093 RepID=G5K888_9STRE|nr:MurR/RpiR family transcriptional regulator [Streptococcus pseudoporcinus]EFR44920.1 SIS domain protein [Streptococcus pseudoporcinus SPIN 20026]EHI64468.1 SIS domain protein [Streptococcus pseudoporcinus LQ 940-04]VEF94033.1 transcription regulator [Streptococcus pseudoporcinus]
MRRDHRLISQIEDALDQMTDLEKKIARFFIETELDDQNLRATSIITQLHISQSALTRFAKKCGFAGYRAFSFEYSKSLQESKVNFQPFHLELTKRVLFDYDTLINKTYDLVDESKLQNLATYFDKAERIYFYGKGSSALVAQEMKLRFMRLGLICDAYSDTDGFTWANSLVNQNCLVFGFSLSGKTQSVIEALDKASQKGAKVILLTTNNNQVFPKNIDTIPVASNHKLNYGNRISPQFPLLIMMDIIYAYVSAINKAQKEEIFKHTIIK